MSTRASFVLRVLAGSVLLGAAGVLASCPIKLSPPSVVVKYGDPVSINCSTSDSQVDGMGWEATEGGISLRQAKHLTWTVQELTDWSIQPSCFINPLEESTIEQCNETAIVVLYKFPENISLTSSSGSSGVMKEGEEYRLTCTVQNIAPVQKLKIRWYRGDDVIMTESFNDPKREPIDASSVYKFRPNRHDSGATFRCEAHSDLGPEGPRYIMSPEEFNITVQFGPDIRCSSNESLDIQEGESLEKHCQVTGSPTPSVRWLKGDQPIDPTAPLSREDAGRYTLDAEGAFSIQPVFIVLISYGPELSCPSNYTVLENAPVTLTCNVTGFPQPKTTWYKDGKELELPERLTRSDSGLYMMTASNKLSSVNRTVEITVTFGPDIQCSSDELLEILEEESLEKHCQVTGNPTPSIRWLKGDQVIDPTAPLSREDAGRYTLSAVGASFVQPVFTVLISYGPELSCPSNYTVLENAPVTLTCNVTGFPQPKTAWYKDDEEVELPERLTRSDSGLYVMTASNKRSSVNRTVEITVTYPPSQIVELEDSEVDVGSTVSLKCSSMGNPRPKYSWSFYRSDNVKEENDDGVSRLIIYNATAHNMGNYTCHAWNHIGIVSKTAKVIVKGARRECPLVISPDRMVVQYRGAGRSATCEPTSTGSENVREVYWQVGEEIMTNASWSADTDKDWDPRPVCTATFIGIGMCQKHLHYTLYRTPDSISIHPVNSSGPLLEQEGFQLQCDITNVAPAENLLVRWYRGNQTIKTERKGSIRLTGCLSEKGCGIEGIRIPVNVSSTISIDVNRTHNGAEFRCEALLDLGSEGPQPSPNMMSSPHNITVYYKPLINTAKLPKIVPVFRGYPEELMCEADGHPLPKIKWSYSPDKVPHVSGDMLIVSEAGFYNCCATNEVDSMSYVVEVILKEDYLPLIAGFVAVTVVAISIVFLFIYSIYYKNTKMRRYSLKNPRLSNHNGNVAHNGWDLQFPMTKLS